MTTLENPSLEGAPEANASSGRLILQIGLACFALLAAGGALMWWQFGPIIFIDMLAALQNCF